jgi:nitroimidazol reductase NimA-like FMN-containing flavoprotein (pyridoxamine 5'-phosphate oxidase superfamily)
MSREDRRTSLDGANPEVLIPAECRRLLASGRVGRVAISVNALPAILPVQFTLDGDEIVFRAPPAGVLANATRRAVVAFETDGFEPGAGEWSVLVAGVARHRGEDVGPSRWAPCHRGGPSPTCSSP